MKTRIISILIVLIAALGIGALLIPGQITGVITQRDRPVIAVPDFRGVGDAQKFMAIFNQTLWDQLAGSGFLPMAPKASYPLEVPQQPTDFKAPTMIAPPRPGTAPKAQSNGPWLTDWSGPPVKASNLAFGYTFV